MVDAHPEDIGLTDYVLNGEEVPFTLGHQMQLADALFHAGISETENQYGVSGNTVNEWEDTANKLHFYILKNNMTPSKYGEFLSYEIAVLRTDGVAVDGDLTVTAGETVAATPGLVAVQNFNITNTGTATDIVRVGVEGLDWDVTLLNNLYAIKAGETINVPVYVEVPRDLDIDAMEEQTLVLTASSESNAEKVGSATVSSLDLVYGARNNLRLATKAHLVKKGESFSANAYFREAVNSNAAVLTFDFDTDKFAYEDFTPAEGVALLDTASTATGVQLTVMKQDYNTKDYGVILFSAKEDVNLGNEENELTLTVDYVLKLEDGTKEVKTEVASTIFTTTTIEEGDVSLLGLSDVIDAFGMTNRHPDWNQYKYFDYNNNNMIDIFDIVSVAKLTAK
jgi:hypothetical protein